MSGGGPNTITNALRILETVARLGTGTTAKEVTEALQMPPATAYRVLNALVGDEYLARTSDLRGFALGHAISGLITAAAPPTVPTAARRAVEEFRSGNRFAVHLIMYRNASLRIADEDPDYPLQSAFNMLRYPHASAAGKLMLAEVAGSGVALLRGPLMKLTPNTITDRRKLENAFIEIRTTGEAVEVDELEPGSARLAVPIRLADGEPGGAVCLSGPTERFTAVRKHADGARDLASRLAPLLF